MTTTDRPWVDALRALLGLLLPVDCVGCGRPDHALCPACRSALDAAPRHVRLVAGVRLDAAFVYDGLVRVLLLELKLRGRVDLAGPLGTRLGALVRAALADAPPGTVLLRVPPSRTGRRRRGFDPVLLLLGRAGVRGAGPTAQLRRVRPGPTADERVDGGTGRRGRGQRRRTVHAGGQKERTALERVDATVGTLVAPALAGRTVVLVDDVVTTGVTMAEAVRAVRAAGGAVVRCVCAASVPE